MEVGDLPDPREAETEDAIMKLSFERLEHFLVDARRACAEDAQEIVGEIHTEYDEAPIFVLLYRDHDLNRFGRNLADVMLKHFPDRVPPFTVSAITQDERTERHHAFVDGPRLLEELAHLRPFTADTSFPRLGEDVFESRVSERAAPSRIDGMR
ncbi:hypothetical protein [Salinarimonas rosea]|uniref:hypothetical protein n=1 Tax=Salinarimonas rosea TaxID=552063 RepID=UPI0004145F0F|nr:hypothetical protein [Salinarimonas rosea]